MTKFSFSSLSRTIKKEKSNLNARQELKGLGSWLFNDIAFFNTLAQARDLETTVVDLIHIARLITRELANRTAEQETTPN